MSATRGGRRGAKQARNLSTTPGELPRRWQSLEADLRESAIVARGQVTAVATKELEAILAVTIPLSDEERGWVGCAEHVACRGAAPLIMQLIRHRKHHLINELGIGHLVAIDEGGATPERPYPLKVLGVLPTRIEIPVAVRHVCPVLVAVVYDYDGKSETHTIVEGKWTTAARPADIAAAAGLSDLMATTRRLRVAGDSSSSSSADDSSSSSSADDSSSSSSSSADDSSSSSSADDSSADDSSSSSSSSSSADDSTTDDSDSDDSTTDDDETKRRTL